MPPIIKPNSAGPTSEAEIAALESYLGHALPEEYRSFLLQHNGGQPQPDAVTINIFGDDEEDLVMCLFPVRDPSIGSVEVEEMEQLRVWPVHCAWDDLQSDLKNLYEQEFEYPLLPIGTDGSCNYYCIELSGPDRGSVHFLENEMADTQRLAPSFDAFLNLLRPRERTDYAEELD